MYTTAGLVIFCRFTGVGIQVLRNHGIKLATIPIAMIVDEKTKQEKIKAKEKTKQIKIKAKEKTKQVNIKAKEKTKRKEIRNTK